MVMLASRCASSASAKPEIGSASATAHADARSSSLRGRLAALAGAAGAAAIGGGEAAAVTYTPTPGIAAAQGIPGFSFVSSTNVTLGELRGPIYTGPPSPSTTFWSVDGDEDDFALNNYGGTSAGFNSAGGELLARSSGTDTYFLRNVATGFVIDGAQNWFTGVNFDTLSQGGNAYNPFFTKNVSGQFGFRLDNPEGFLYGWGSLVIDGTPVGQGFKITEAYYNTTAGAAISVGQVPVAVPEPASMTLMALGAAGVAAWRARRTVKAAAGAESAAETET